MITIIDYAINNLRSVEKAFQGLGVAVEASDDPCKIGAAEKLVLPGVGAFADAMSALERAREAVPDDQEIESLLAEASAGREKAEIAERRQRTADQHVTDARVCLGRNDAAAALRLVASATFGLGLERNGRVEQGVWDLRPCASRRSERTGARHPSSSQRGSPPP